MDLRQLASLVAVAETGTFSAAAIKLHTVQSNVSTHVARLERELGVTLVDYLLLCRPCFEQNRAISRAMPHWIISAAAMATSVTTQLLPTLRSTR